MEWLSHYVPIQLSESDEYHKKFYDQHLWRLKFLGYELFKCPLDLWIYQELIFETKPKAIIETGTHAGGSALFFAALFDAMGADSSVLIHTIDVLDGTTRPVHPRIRYHLGSSIDPKMVDKVRSEAHDSAGGAVMVVLDSDHTRDHVFAEMTAYGPTVGPGHYMIVEDSNINGHPVLPGIYGHLQGPYEAIEKYLPLHPEFEVDRTCERFGVTQNPMGYLKRV
jgi:cephalosporin hydroxylase